MVAALRTICRKVNARGVTSEESVPATSTRDLETLQARARQLLNQEIRFVYAAEFAELDKDDAPVMEACLLLDELRGVASAGTRPADVNRAVDGEESQQSCTWSSPDPLLTFEQEQILFRAMNLLRYRVNRQRSRLSESNPSLRTIEKIESKLKLVEQIRSQLVNSNLRLVTSISRKFAASFVDVDEFSSDGCMILLGAIDRFDFSRGFRFSTYATHSIQRHFFRAWKTRQRRRERFPVAPAEVLCNLAQDVSDVAVCGDPQSVVGELLSHAELVLDERERRILLDRFGLDGGDENGRTLREIASDLGISKERVRQLQMKALEKLRKFINPDQINPDFLLGCDEDAI